MARGGPPFGAAIFCVRFHESGLYVHEKRAIGGSTMANLQIKGMNDDFYAQIKVLACSVCG